MAEAGKERGAVAGGGKARRVAQQQENKQRAAEAQGQRHEALQLNETGQAWARGELDSNLKPASLHGLVNRAMEAQDPVAVARATHVFGLGPAAGVELKEAQEDLQAHERQREHQFDLPPDLVAMRGFMSPQAWDRVLEERAMRLVQEETAERRDQMLAYQRDHQGMHGCAVVAEQQIKQRVKDLGLVGGMAPEPQKGVWAELENLRHQVLKAHQGAEGLAERLGGVLVPEPDLVADRVPGPYPASRISEEVHLIAVSVVRVQDLLEGLLGRLDL